jgi:hypothetical protein
MVSDDDTEPREPRVFRSRPLEFRDPEDDEISTAIEQMAREKPSWGRRQILEAVRVSGLKLEEAHVNYVLREHNLPNLDL